jgi:hypothetical protein
MSIKLGIIYINGFYDPENIAISSNYYFINELFPYLVIECANILSINDIIFISIPITFDENLNQSYLESIFNQNPDCNHFIFSGTTIYLSMLINEYFRYYPEKIIYSVNSSQIGSDYNDNVFRLLPNDYGLNNFIANIYLKNKNFDLFFFTGSYYTQANGIISEGVEQISTSLSVINDFLKSIGKTMKPNPVPFLLNSLEDFNLNLRTYTSQADYYSTNYYTSLNIPYVPNSKALEDNEFYSQYYNSSPNLFYKVSDKAISSYNTNNGVITYSDNSIIPQIEKFISYLYNYDFTSEKSIVVYISYAEFPILLSKLASRFNVDTMKKMENTLVFILSNIHNRDEYTWDLFNSNKTNTLWYNNSYNWYNLLDLFNVKIHFPRCDQSMFYLYSLLNNYFLELIEYDLKLDRTAQPGLEAVFNALNLVYHFNKNNINIRSFITSYFQNSKLLQFQNNMVFNSNMDSIYGVYVATTFFFEGETAIGSRNFTLLEQLTNNELNIDQNINRQITRSTASDQAFIKGDKCRPVTSVITKTSSSQLKLVLCERKRDCGVATKTAKNDRLLKDTCYRCNAAVCKKVVKANN